MIISKYTCIVPIGNTQYFLNTFNSALIELDGETFQKITAVMGGEDVDEVFSAQEKGLLCSEGFLIEPEEDLRRILAVKMGYHFSKYKSTTVLKIDIGVTDKCNFVCPYCFENGNKNSDNFPMGKYTQTEFFSEIRSYISDCAKSGTKEVQVVWYGGEPSLELEFICFANKKLLQDSLKYGFKYSNIIITNGYALEEKFIKVLETQNVSYVQITLDGLKDTHNSRRNTLPKADSFNAILKNIDLLIAKSMEVVIRINIDSTNYTEIPQLLFFLHSRFGSDVVGRLLFVSFGRVFGSVSSLGHFDYESVYHDVYTTAAKLGLISPNFEETEVGAFCGAETSNSDIVVDFKGNIYKCWNDIFDEPLSVGNIYHDKGVDNIDKKTRTEMFYLEELSLDNINGGECLTCEFIKYCGGLCPYNRKLIVEGKEENIFHTQKCKDIVRKRISTHIEAYLCNL